MLRCPFVGCPGAVDTSGQSTVRRFWMAGNHTLLLQKERRRIVNGAWEERADMLTARRECGQTRLRSEMSHKLLHHPRPPMSWKPRRAPRYAVCGHVIFAPLNKLVVLASLCSNGNSQNFDSYLILSSALLTLSSRRCPEVCTTKIHSSLQPRLVTEEAVECASDTPTCSSSSVCLLSATPPFLAWPFFPLRLSVYLQSWSSSLPTFSLNISTELSLESHLHKTITKGARVTFLYGPGSIALTNEADIRQNKLLVLYRNFTVGIKYLHEVPKHSRV